MQKSKVMKSVSITLIIIGFTFVLNSFLSITGFIVAEEIGKGISGIIGIILIVGGILIFIGKKNLMELIGIYDYAKDKDYQRLKEKLRREEGEPLNAGGINSKIKLIERAHINGSIDEVRTANMINKIFNNQLKQIIYKYGISLTIGNGINRYSLDESKKDKDLAYALYDRIIANNPRYEKNCQLHISKTESTKHHKRGLQKK